MNKRKVRIKKLPNNKRKVRIVKYPSTDYTLPNSVGYAGAVYPVFAYGGYLPIHQTQGVVGGVNTPHDKSIVGALTGNLGNPIDIQAQDNITFNPTGTGMPTNPYEAADPYMTNVQVSESAIDEQEKNTEAKESGEYTQDFRAVRNFDGDAYNLQVNRFKNIGSGVKERKELGEIMEAFNAGNYDRSSRDEGSDTLDPGDYQSNTGDFRLADKGPKSLGRYVKGQMGGSLPKAQTGLQGKAKKKYDQGVVTRTKDKSRVKDMTKLEGTDNVYYSGKEGTSREIKRSSGTSKFQGTDAQYSKNICEAMKNGVYKGVSAEEMAKKGKISTGRIAEFKACENIEPDKVDVVEIFEEEVTTDDTPKTTENCNCPNDAEGEATGTIVTKEDGTQECECEETTTEGMAQPKQPGEAGYLLQDSMGTTRAAIDRSKLKTFLPAMNQVDLEEKEAVFLDPLAAQRANQAAAQATQNVIGSQAGNNTSRLIAAQAAAADTAAKIDADIANKNVQIAGNIGADNVDTRNKEQLLNAQNRQKYMDDYTRAMQAGINADIAYSGALTAKQQQALERKWKIDAMNQQNEQFNMDPVSGGRIYATGVERAPSPERPTDLTQSLEKYNKYVDDDAAVKLAIYEDKKRAGQQGYGGADLSGLMSLYGRQKGGPIIFAEGGENPNPYGADVYKNIELIYPDGHIETQSMNEKMFKSGYIDYKHPVKKNFADGTTKTQYRYNPEGGFGLPRVNYKDTSFVQQGGPIYEHGGPHKTPFGTTNVNQILPPGYSDYYNGGDVIPNASQTTRTIGAVPREDANLEAEGGEVVYGDINGDTFPEVNTIVGPRHAQGGVPLNLPDDTFIFSDYKTGGMKISDPEILKMFGKSGKKKKGSRKKPGYTPAQLAKQYDINKYRAILEDPNSDNISRRTAELMIENYNMKLGGLAIAQESSKGFPQGIPMVARPYMEANGISEEDLIPPPPQQMAMQGGQMMPQQPMTGAPEMPQEMPQQGMMRYGGWRY
tara:strand:+ start:9240 stop:12245 length:3006 start_codon:yes stop_codon:yes gene_type:complete